MTTSATVGSHLETAIEAAIRAPSLRNTQPWRFAVASDRIHVFADQSRQLTVADPDGRALRVSCGAAIFNLRLAIAHLGHEAETTLLPDTFQPDLLATVRAGALRPASPIESALYAAIPRRHSSRGLFLDQAVPLAVQFQLKEAARTEGAWLELLIGSPAVATVAELVRTADQILNRSPAYAADGASWSRQIDRASAALPPDRDNMLIGHGSGHPTKPGTGSVESNVLIGILGGHGDSSRHDLLAGQALQHLLLAATAAGLVVSLISEPIDVPAVREQLRIGLRRHGTPTMLLRIGYGPTEPPTPRRPIAAVLMPAGQEFQPSSVTGHPGTTQCGQEGRTNPQEVDHVRRLD